MQNVHEIRHHISAVEQTKKITSAMQVVSSTRMQKVLSHIEYNHRYFMRVQETMKDILLSSRNLTHPYLTPPPTNKRTLIVIAGDKGMAGSYNSNVLSFAEKHLGLPEECALITLGNVAESYFIHRGRIPDITYLGVVQDPTLDRARELVFSIMDLFDKDITDEVDIVYTSFYGTTKNKPVLKRLLPILADDYHELDQRHEPSDFIYEPSLQTVFDTLVPQYLVGIIFGVLVQAYASEHYSRMNAMQSATTNADKMLKALRLNYNIARQTAITQELTEITGGSEIIRSGGR